MKPTTKFIRFSNHEHFIFHQENIPQKFFESEDGNYQLIILNDQDNFILKISTGQIIKDSFTDFGDRADLYKLIEVGEVYNWMLEVMVIAHINQAQMIVKECGRLNK